MPIFTGFLFQQMYHTADSVIVGSFLGKEALAAVASSGSTIFLLTGFLFGLFTGAGVLIARYYGAGDAAHLKNAVHNDILLALCMSALLSLAGCISSPFILKLMDTPDEVMPSAVLYFRIYFSGLSAPVLYNCAAEIMRAAGDSRRPLYYLISASCLNIVLDLVFICIFNMGVGGAATATVISQGFSAFLAFRRLMKVNDAYRFSFREIRADLPMLKEILYQGLPAGVQNSVIAFSNMFVQTHINSFGTDAMAGTAAFLKLEGFAFMPILSFMIAVTTFVSQNRGAGLKLRARKGARIALILSAITAETIALLLRVNVSSLMRIFTADPSVILYGRIQSSINSTFYFLPALSHCMGGILRGLKRPMISMLIMLTCWCGIRVIYLHTLLQRWHTIRILYAVYPFTWGISTLAFSTALYFVYKNEQK